MNCAKCSTSLEGRSVYSIEGVADRWCMDCAPLEAAPKEICLKPAAVHSIKAPQEKSVRETLQAMMDRADEFRGVIVVAQRHDNEEFLRSSRMELKDKAALNVFFQAYIMSLYRIVYEDKND